MWTPLTQYIDHMFANLLVTGMSHDMILDVKQGMVSALIKF
jgi:hypothetical protein